MTDFPKLLQVLSEYRVEFIIIGGAAAIVHGSSRLTQDLDVVYHRSQENITRLANALQEQKPYLRGAPPGLPFQWSEATIRMGLNFTLQTNLGDLDLLGEVTGGGKYEDLLDHTFEIEVFGVHCLCLNLETLIHVKRAVGRPKDLEAISELEAIQEEQQDEE
ncbi:MAG: nucleotidyltransferase [Candidatus Latescibacteria bacterium]|nr:nucleotidyltransferase [Candidatus Latescibacterota bacterium]